MANTMKADYAPAGAHKPGPPSRLQHRLARPAMQERR